MHHAMFTNGNHTRVLSMRRAFVLGFPPSLKMFYLIIHLSFIQTFFYYSVHFTSGDALRLDQCIPHGGIALAYIKMDCAISKT